MHVKIYGPGDRIGVTCQGKNAGQIRILRIQMCLEGAAIGELPVGKLGMKIKLERIGIAAQSTVAHGEH